MSIAVPAPVAADPTMKPGRLIAALQRDAGRIGGFIRRQIADPDEAEDLLQDVLLRALDAPIDEVENLAAWLFAAARNRIIDWRRRRARRPADSLDAAGAPEPASPALAGARTELQQRFWDELLDALDELPVEQREVFVQHELEGKAFKEIAAATGENINTLLSRKRYAALYLRVRLKELYADFSHVEDS